MHFSPIQTIRETDGALLEEMHVHAGVAATVLRQEHREQVFEILRRGADAQDSALAVLERAGPLAERLGLQQEATAPPQDVLTLGGQLDAASDAVEEPHA